MVLADTSCIDSPYLLLGNAQQQELAEISREIGPALDRFPSLGDAFETAAPKLCVSKRMDGAFAFLDVEANRIVIDDSLPKAMKTGVLLHEIRHLWQVSYETCPSDELAMKEYARATFALEADASAISLLVAWNMLENGQGAAWDALSAWNTQSDIAAVFADAITETGDAGYAVKAAFHQWYASPARVESYYHSSCSDYLDRQDASHAIPQFRLLPDGFFDRLCKLPDGTSYECSEPDSGPY